jgi:hypothetical protein
MPTYSKLNATVLGTALQADLEFGDTLGRKISLPAFNKMEFSYGTGLGKVNLLGFQEGTAFAAPADVDIKATTDPNGAAINFARVRAVLIQNRSDVDGRILKWDGTVTNGWLAPFDSIATAKLVILAGATVNGVLIPGIVLLAGPNLTGYVTGSGSKVLRLDPGANTVPWRVELLGVDA